MNCYCSRCRATFNSSHSTVIMCFTRRCRIRGGTLTYTKTHAQLIPFLGVCRGKCSACQTPVIEHGYGLFFPFSFISSRLIGIESVLNFYYGSRGAGYADVKPAKRVNRTIVSNVGSCLSMIWYTFLGILTLMMFGRSSYVRLSKRKD